MEPVTTALITSAILGGAQGLSSWMGGSAQRAAEKRQKEQEALSTAYQMKKAALNQNLERQQSALSDLIASYRSNLGSR